MENLYAIRDAFFWWAGVWASVTLGNYAVNKALKRRGREERKREREQWRREFAAFLFDASASPDGAKIDEPKAVAEEAESAESD